MTWENNQGWHLGRAREPSRLPEQLPQLRIDPGSSSRRCRRSSSKHRSGPVNPHRGWDGERLMTVLTDSAAQAGRGHALTIDSGWSEVADTAPAFIQRFTQGQKGGSHAY
jgi:hypothetical protein